MLDVHEFEYVPAGGDLTLLRLAGVWSPPTDAPAECRLLVLTGVDEEWFEPLSQNWGDDSWRAAWTLPLSIATSPAARFVLVPPSDQRLELPPPIEHGMAAREIAVVRAELEDERRRADDLEALLERLRARLDSGDQRLAEVEDRAAALRAAIRAAA